MDLKESLISNLNKAYDDRYLDLNFEIMSLSMSNFTLKKLQNVLKNKEEADNSVIYYRDAKKVLDSKNLNYKMLLFEKNFLNMYSHFEELCYNNLFALYKYYPKFLSAEELKVNYKEIFNQNEIEYVRERIISKKVKSIIQGSNTFNLIKKFKSIFGIQIDLKNEDFLNQLFIISLNRNVLAHNKGKVNSIYLMELEKYDIPTKLELNDYVLKEIKEHQDLRTIWNFLENIIETITNTIIKDIPRLENYNKKYV